MPILANCVRKSITLSCSSISVMPIWASGRIYIPFIMYIGNYLFIRLSAPSAMDGSCTQRTAVPFPPCWGRFCYVIMGCGVPISPCEFCRLIIRWGFPKVASDLILKQIYGCGLDLPKKIIYKNAFNLLNVPIEVPVMAYMFLNDIPFLSNEISCRYCSLYASSDFR